MKKTVWQKIWEKFVPKHIRSAVKNVRILEKDYGHFQSAKHGMSVDKNGQPIPWFSYPAIEYLNQLNLSDKTVFEYGSGNSSLYWAKVARQVISLEDNEKWYQIIKKSQPENLNLKLIVNPEEFISEIKKYDKFDIIIIDSEKIETRFGAADIAPNYLKEGGFIILDNADWYHDAAQLLREQKLIEVDFTGFAPIIGYTTTTSFFFHRDFNFSPKHKQQPVYGIGSLTHDLVNPQTGGQI